MADVKQFNDNWVRQQSHKNLQPADPKHKMGQVKTRCRRWEISGKRRKTDESEVKAARGPQITAKPLPVKAKQGGPRSSAGEVQEGGWRRERKRKRRLDKWSAADKFKPQQLAVEGDKNGFYWCILARVQQEAINRTGHQTVFIQQKTN